MKDWTSPTPRSGHKFSHVAENENSLERGMHAELTEKENAQCAFLRLAQIALAHSTQDSPEHCHLLVEAKLLLHRVGR